MATKEEVFTALKEVFDPEIPVNVVDLGLIYDVEINPEGKAIVTMTLTTPGCGMAYNIAMQVKMRTMQVPGVKEATVTVVWEPKWDPSKMSPDAKKKLGIP
jgi:metal-sulfur cluster biosynthetic enzyme